MERKFKSFKKKILPRIINDSKEREEAIKNNIPARFEIKRNSNLDTGSKLWDNLRTFDTLGKKAITENDKSILKYAQKHNIDPDITRSIMYAENSRGHYGGLNRVADIIRKSESVLPMNIQKNRWSPLVDKKPEEMYDADINIETGTVLLKRITERLDKPDAAQIGLIRNSSGIREISEFGEYVEKIYKEKPWRKLN